jgi:type IV secretory pathway VirB3-like protein
VDLYFVYVLVDNLSKKVIAALVHFLACMDRIHDESAFERFQIHVHESKREATMIYNAKLTAESFL